MVSLFYRALIPLLFLFTLQSSSHLFAKRLVLSIDDAPMRSQIGLSRSLVFNQMLSHLEEEDAKAVFFVLGENISAEEEGLQLIKKASDEGHLIANHTYSHFHLSNTPKTEFIRDVMRLEELVGAFKNYRRWFRYPFLDYGNRTSSGGSWEKAYEAAQVLERLGYCHGYVTLNTFDWYVNSLLVEAKKEERTLDWERLERFYLGLIEEWIEIGLETSKERGLNEDFCHMLLLHGNDLNAHLLGNVIRYLKLKDWEISHPDHAFEAAHPLQSMELFLQQSQHSRVTWKAHKAFDLAYIRERFEKEVLELK